MKKSLLTAALLMSATALFAQDKVYYFDDFEWLKPATDTYVNSSKQSIADNVGDNYSVTQYNPQLKTGIFPDEPKKTMDRFLAMDYIYLPESVASTSVDFVGVAKNYIKVAITSKEGGIGLPLIEEFGNGTEGVHFSFKATPMGAKKDGVPVYDKTKISVIVRTGNAEETVQTIDFNVPDGTDYKWYEYDVELPKLTQDSRVIVRNADDQYPTVTGTYRWFIDDVKLYAGGAGVGEIAVDENAPVKFYNLQGVEVSNPENGVFIRRQGAKTSKMVIK